MSKTEKTVLRVLTNKKVKQMPVWLMRQAGRYLPEYSAVRRKAENFIQFCLTPDLATEVTLQPVRRFGVDAAILFADILLIPFALGQKTEFVEAIGPRLHPLSEIKQLGALKWDSERVDAVYETVSRVRADLPETTTMLGFAGSPWTVACYMIEGQGHTGFLRALNAAHNTPDFMKFLFELLHDVTLEYLGRQIEAGVEAVQLFDSHAGLLNGQAFRDYVITPTKKLVQALKAEYPDVPVIGFPRGASEEDVQKYLAETGVDCLSIDQYTSLDFAQNVLRGIKPLQGNLDPEILLRGGDPVKRAVDDIFKRFGPNHVFNLGHGIIKETPPQHVADLVTYIQQLRE